MKKKIVEIVLGVILTAMVLAGCGSTGNKEYAGETVWGQVTEIGEDTITVEIGTQEMMAKPEEGTGEGESAEDTEAKEVETEDTSGEVCTFEVGDDTKITRMGMGGQMSGGMEKPEGMEEGEMPEGMEEGEMPEGMEKPEGMEEGEMPEGMEKPEGMEEGEMPEGMEKPEGMEEGEMPEGMEKPEGMEEGEMPEGMEKPEGMEDGDVSQVPQGGGNMGDAQEEITLSDIQEGDTVSITFDDNGEMETIAVMSMGDMGGGMMQGGVESYDAVNEYTENTDVKDTELISTGTDENAVLISEGAEVTLDNVTVTRESADSTGGDNSSFYGVGAAVLNTEGTAYIKDSTVSSDAAGGAGIFSYANGVTYVADTKITTQQDTSGGVHVAGGGTLYAWDLDIETNGESAAAIRSDRGSGTMVVDGGEYVSNGVGSPAIYSTADIAVNDADLEATGSEAVCIEGLNSIHLYDSDISGNMAENEQNDCIWNVILYQSMSGDSEVGNSTFQMQGGSLTAENGGMFYTTNTESTFIISDVDITYSKENPFFLKCTGNKNQRGWGSEGSNGADCTFTAINQEMEGDIVWDSISELDFYMTDGSVLTGAVVDDESCAGNGGDGYCNLYIEKGSTWIVTEDSTLSNLYCAGSIQDEDGNFVTIQDKDGNVLVEGDCNITVTVDNYEEKADVSGASALAAWSEYEVEKPSQLK